MFHLPLTWTHQDAAFSGVHVWNPSLQWKSQFAACPSLCVALSTTSSGAEVLFIQLWFAGESYAKHSRQLLALISHCRRGGQVTEHSRIPLQHSAEGRAVGSPLDESQIPKQNLFLPISPLIDTVTQPDGTFEPLRVALEILPSSRDSLQFHPRLIGDFTSIISQGAFLRFPLKLCASNFLLPTNMSWLPLSGENRDS
jgi:hypothetical protein